MYRGVYVETYYLKYYLFLLLLLSIVILFYIYYESYRRRKENLPRGKIVELWNKAERRRFKRLKTILEIRYEILDNYRYNQEAKTRDISQGGIGLVIYEKLKAGTPLRIWMNFSSKKERTFLLGNIVWTKEVFTEKADKRTFFAGIMFTAVDTATQLQLFDYISQLESQPNVLYVPEYLPTNKQA
jgi:hypothetical protein